MRVSGDDPRAESRANWEQVAAGWERRCFERVDAITIGILEPRAQTIGLPIVGAAQLGLEAAGRDRDHRRLVVGNPVRLMIVVKLDRSAGCRQRDVGTARDSMETVIFVPGVIERRLVLIIAGWNSECALPDIIAGIVG